LNITRILKLIIAIFVFKFDQVNKFILWCLRKKTPGSCVVLCYHSISYKFKKRFEKQINIIKKYSEVIPPFSNIYLESGKKFCIVTFDDGYKNLVENAIPILVKYNIPSVLFIVTSCFDSFPDWIQEKNNPDKYEKILSIDDLRKIPEDLISIGSHTDTHPQLEMIPKEVVRKELEISKSKLENLTGKKVEMFAVPFGKYKRDLFEIARKVGYKRIFTSDPLIIKKRIDNSILGRFDVSPLTWNIELKLILNGSYRHLPFFFELKRKLRSFFKLVF